MTFDYLIDRYSKVLLTSSIQGYSKASGYQPGALMQ